MDGERVFGRGLGSFGENVFAKNPGFVWRKCNEPRRVPWIGFGLFFIFTFEISGFRDRAGQYFSWVGFVWRKYFCARGLAARGHRVTGSLDLTFSLHAIQLSHGRWRDLPGMGEVWWNCGE